MAEPPRPVRLAAGDELAFTRAVVHHFHEDQSDEELRHWLPEIEAENYRAWVVRDGGEIIANFGVFGMDLSLPGGGAVPMAGVTAVGVSQFHRRRGLLTAMMTAALDEAVEAGEPVATLFASEAAIYGRYGFGVVAAHVDHRIDRAAVFRDPVAPGLVESATPETAVAAWPGIFDAMRRQRPGCASRNPGLWQIALVQDPSSWRDGASGRRLAHVPGRGYAAYRIKDASEHGLPAGEVRVAELVATDAEAEAALWQHVCDIDLTTTIRAGVRPVDDALPELLVDRLRARTSTGPPLYGRLLDVAAAFSARGYATAGTAVIAVVDDTRDQSGTYRLDVAPDGAEVYRTDTAPELTLPIDAAASIWLGGVRATQLLAARRITEHVPGAAARLDRLVAVDRAPWTPFVF